MIEESQSDQSHPSWTQNLSDKEYVAPDGYVSQAQMAQEIVMIVTEEFRKRGIEVTFNGRKKLRDAYKNKMKEPRKFELQEGSESKRDAAIKLVDLAMENENDIFGERYKRVGAIVALNIVDVIERLARSIQRCPVWPFC